MMRFLINNNIDHVCTEWTISVREYSTALSYCHHQDILADCLLFARCNCITLEVIHVEVYDLISVIHTHQWHCLHISRGHRSYQHWSATTSVYHLHFHWHTAPHLNDKWFIDIDHCQLFTKNIVHYYIIV